MAAALQPNRQSSGAGYRNPPVAPAVKMHVYCSGSALHMRSVSRRAAAAAAPRLSGAHPASL